MSPSNHDTQPVRAIQSRPSCLKRIVQLLFLAIGAVGIFAFGYAIGSGVEILAPANALIETAIASFPDSLQALSARSPQLTVTPQPADTVALVTTDADRPVATDKPSNTPVPTDTATDTPVPTNTLTDTPIPTATELAPTRTPYPLTQQRIHRFQQPLHRRQHGRPCPLRLNHRLRPLRRLAISISKHG